MNDSNWPSWGRLSVGGVLASLGAAIAVVTALCYALGWLELLVYYQQFEAGWYVTSLPPSRYLTSGTGFVTAMVGALVVMAAPGPVVTYFVRERRKFVVLRGIARAMTILGLLAAFGLVLGDVFPAKNLFRMSLVIDSLALLVSASLLAGIYFGLRWNEGLWTGGYTVDVLFAGCMILSTSMLVSLTKGRWHSDPATSPLSQVELSTAVGKVTYRVVSVNGDVALLAKLGAPGQPVGLVVAKLDSSIEIRPVGPAASGRRP